MTPYASKPWLAHYASGHTATIDQDYPDALSLFRAAVARAPHARALLYFDGAISYSELDQQSDALACAWLERGLARGDRVAIYLQNVPQFVIALVAAWKIGAIAVPVNPMNRSRELRVLLADSAARVLVCHGTLYDDVVLPLLAEDDTLKPHVMTTSALEYQTRNDARLFAGMTHADGATATAGISHAGAEDFATAIAAHSGQKPPPIELHGDDIAMFVYTSGTTGVPKGAMNTHGNMAFNAQVYRDWVGLREGAPILGVAPLFHITGLVGHVGAAFICAAPLVLAYRFEPGVILDAIAEHKPEFTIGAITVFIALMNDARATREHFASMRRIYSGGAPIPPSVIEAFRARFGHYIHNGYGLTETNSPTHVVPVGRDAPVDAASGTLSIGVPAFNVESYIGDDMGRPLPAGEVGEIISRGPMVVPGYWNKPQESAKAIVDGFFRTGDVGFMDEHGWFYLVDRKKDMINAGGYKVWPREVEDVLYTHPAVREAAVVGVPDSYRGETVKAVVSLKPQASATPEELVEYCKARMAAYKYPRIVAIIDELPKTVTGKILRRELRG
ncbi:long-chain fatty acid--CoA ligase [Paraburkholderia sp. Ac-20340]|uniref:class I adenylate-forming enzyme family protein n=1 Tax=Paraburkholderia sp. Ac-20340 TaxID=2703888 RepID=UPI0019817B84|nr:AMP-binding protein [Paraburkholderia sp. Ac-20340]MBN3856259.1 long-chain fatty acid--CoA ligase [Paraburkholderia sp. Ac-20340]